MSNKELIPLKSLRKLDRLILQNKTLFSDKELQQKIIFWAGEMLKEAKEEWYDIHATTIDAVVIQDRKLEAQRRAEIKDAKYAPFREYFKKVQQAKFIEMHKRGQKLSASGFVRYFLKNKAQSVDIPYKNSNLQNKLNQLAQANNREFKKASA